MTLLLGCSPEAYTAGAQRLAPILARSAGEELVVAVVIPEPWVPGMARVDAEYQAFLEEQAGAILNELRAELPSDVRATFVRHRARSTPAGLLELAERHEAKLIVLGSASTGLPRRVALGSVTDHLLHSSRIPLVLAPRGFRSEARRVVRVSAAFGGGEPTEELVLGGAGVAGRIGASLRLVSFAVRPRASISAGIGPRAEEAVIAEWSRLMEQQARQMIAKVAELPSPPQVEPTVIGRGSTWDEAVEDITWGDDEVLLVGSSRYGPLAQVFLGSRASKIIRHSAVPVVVVPRSVQAALAEQLG